MINPISYPDGTHTLSRLPKIVVEADSMIDMSLWYARSGPLTEVFTGRYQPDFDGIVGIDVSSIVKDYLKTKMPEEAYNDPDLYQPFFEARFVFKISDPNGSDFTEEFKVCNCEPNDPSAATRVPMRYLTNQPIEKPTNNESPEWLTYNDTIGNWSVVGRFYPKTGGSVDMTIRQDGKPGCFSVNVNYARLISQVNLLPSQLKGYYDIILFNGSHNELCRQRFLYEERTGKEHYYLFANRMGGFDTLICQGENVLQPELEHNIGRFGKLYKDLDDADNMRQWQQNTGLVPSRWRNWMYELIASKKGAKLFDPKKSIYHDIVVTSSEIGMGDFGQLANASFGYIMSEANTVIEEDERMLTQSAADAASDFDDLTVEVTLAAAQGYTETVTVNSERLFVTVEGHGRADYYINDSKRGTIDTEEDPDTVVVSVPYGAKVRFETDGIDSITLNWYDGWHTPFGYRWSNLVCEESLGTYSFAWGNLVCIAVKDDSFSFRWSEDRCVQLLDEGYSYRWTEDRCVLQPGGYEFRWSEDRCVMEYIYKLVWEEIPSNEQQLNE